MKVLQVHNKYIRPGGEDTVVAEELMLLESHGHTVNQMIVNTTQDLMQTGIQRAQAGISAIWSRDGYRKVSEAIGRYEPDIVHVHNTFPMLSPSTYWAAARKGVPVVQTLHNYRLTCANSLLLRNDRPCEDCVGRFPFPALKHRCYRGSAAATASVVATMTAHRALGTYTKHIAGYVALTHFARDLMIRAGFPADRIHVKANFTADGDPPEPYARRSRRMTFLGSVNVHKGVELLVRAWIEADVKDADLDIVGDGPSMDAVRKLAASAPNIHCHGHIARNLAVEMLRSSLFLILPSIWYEGMPMVLIEALQAGTPPLVSDLGAMPEIVASDSAGIAFKAGDVTAMATAIRQAFAMAPEEWNGRSEAGRSRYLAAYTKEVNYQKLMRIYALAQAGHKDS